MGLRVWRLVVVDCWWVWGFWGFCWAILWSIGFCLGCCVSKLCLLDGVCCGVVFVAWFAISLL